MSGTYAPESALQSSLSSVASSGNIGGVITASSSGQRKPKSPKSPSRANSGTLSGKKSPKGATTPGKNPAIAAIPTSLNQQTVAAVVDSQPQFTVVDGSQLFHPQLLVAAATAGRPRMPQQQPAYLLQRQFSQEKQQHPQIYQQQTQHQTILAAAQGITP